MDLQWLLQQGIRLPAAVHLLGRRAGAGEVAGGSGGRACGDDGGSDWLVPLIRSRWLGVWIIIRADSAFAREEIMGWCEARRVDYVLGLSKNSVLEGMIVAELAEAKARQAATGKPGGGFKELCDRTQHAVGAGNLRSKSRYAEIHELHFVIFGDANVAGLDVAVNDPRAMRIGERGSDIGGPDGCARKRYRGLRQHLFQVSSRNELHHEKWRAAAVVPDIIELCDGGVRKPPDGLRFPHELLLAVPAETL